MENNQNINNEIKGKEGKEKGKWELLEWIFCIVFAVVLALAVRYFVGTPTIVQQPSMTPTLLHGERLILNRLAITTNQEIKRGEIVTFESPSKKYVPEYDIDLRNPVAEYNRDVKGVVNNFAYHVLEVTKESYIKRVIGVAGDHVQIEDGKVYINGKELEESYLPEGTVTEMNKTYFSDIIVPEGTVFLMGDNRAHSTDSRSFGCIPIDRIESKVLMRFWPLDKFGTVE